MTEENITSVPPAPIAPAPVDSGEKLDYKPVSSWAVAGACIGLAVAVMVVGSVVMALTASDPVFLPAWLVGGLAVGGIVISFIAQRQIVASEGTRTGIKLARWGMWLSVLTGTGFFVFNLSTRLALQSQANAFVMIKSADDDGKRVPDTGFLPRLLEGCAGDNVQFNCAFLLTVRERTGYDPRDENNMKVFDTAKEKQTTATRMGQFRSNDMIRFLRESYACLPDRDSVQIEPMGVVRCDYVPPQDKKGRGHYEVVRNYKVTTPEVVRVFSLDARSIEPSGTGERRKWFVMFPQEQVNYRKATDLGDGLYGLRSNIHVFLSKWKSAGKPRPSEIDKTNWTEFVPTKETREYIRGKLAEFDVNPGGELQILPLTGFDITPWKPVNGLVQISYPVRVEIPPGTTFPKYLLDGYITVESATPVDPAHFPVGSRFPEWKILSLAWVRSISFDAPSARPK